MTRSGPGSLEKYLAASKALLDELDRLENMPTTLANRVLTRKSREPIRAVVLQLLDSCECCKSQLEEPENALERLDRASGDA